MFVVRTRLTAHGTPFAQDALARFEIMSRAGHEPTVVTVAGKSVQPAGLKRWIAAIPSASSASSAAPRDIARA